MLEHREETDQLDRTEIHDVLSNDRRLQVLELLTDDNPRDLRSLADDIAAVESGESPAPREVRQSVYVTLHQNHLPKLDDLNIVEYDDTSKVIELGNRADEIDVYLEIVQHGHLSWTEYYFGVVALGLVSTLASSLGTPVLASLDPAVYASAALLGLLASISLQIREQGSPWFDRLVLD